MARPLSILQITSASSLSGGTRQMLLLAQGLAGTRCRVVVAAPPGSASLAASAELGLDTRPLVFQTLCHQWQSSRALRALVREMGADVVHAHHTKAHNVGVLATFGGGFPPVVANRGVLVPPKFPAKFRSARTSGLVTNSLAAKNVLVGAGVADEKIHVVYNGVGVPDRERGRERAARLRTELGLEDAIPVVGAVGSGIPEKGFQHLVEAAPAIRKAFPAAAFVLVGAGTDRLQDRIRDLGLSGCVRLAGRQPDAGELMGLFDVFVLPSLSESCPNVVLEAMGAAVPQVCSDVGGVREILDGGGYLVPPADSGAIAEAVCRLAADPSAARAMGARGAETVAARFTPARKVEATLDVYRRVLEAPSRRRRAA
ncbi:MAG: glycosyltransferase family 4 protein [Deltaproteobacteria bacterium]|nr:glycosyltransferase family 4 protein [Deltaproteobacteria bacterium]